MYNRYKPNTDGSYTRKRVSEPVSPSPPPVRENSPPPPVRENPPPPPVNKGTHPKQNCPSPGFLQQLLGKDLDVGDLLIILLLLIMAGDSEEGRNNALLTMALYFVL